MKLNTIIEKKTERISALKKLQILNSNSIEEFDNIVALAAQICDTPIAIISFTDNNHVWIKAKKGININEIPYEDAFFGKDTRQDIVLIVNDAIKDKRYFDNPLVKGNTNFRFCTSIPLVTEDGNIPGHLSVIDTKARNITTKQLSGLELLAKQTVIILNKRLQNSMNSKSSKDFRSSNEFMNTIFNNAIDAIILMDQNGEIMHWNPMAEKIFGWKTEDIIGKDFCKTILTGIYQNELQDWINNIEKKSNIKKQSKVKEVLAKHKNKSIIHIALGISPTLIKDQLFYIGFASDITERKQITEKLDKQKSFYENILNSIPTDIAVFDNQHRYLFVNPGAIKDEKLRKFIIGKDDFEYADFRKWDKSVAELRRNQFITVKKTKEEIRWEDNLKDSNGNTKTHLRRMFPVHDEKGKLSMVIGYGIDISERKKMEEKQDLMISQLSTQNKQLYDFCNIVSHNLRAPLVNMSLLVKFIQECNDEEEQKLLITKLKPVIDNLHITFNELVESIQVKQDVDINSVQLNFADQLQKTINNLEVEIKQSNTKIESNFENAPSIYYPAKYLTSIFHNLISNSLKYKSPKRNPVIKVETRKNNENIILSVSDNGIGIDLIKNKNNLFKIGKVFHRHPNAKGFGLFMTKTQVEAMEGKIWAESTPDKGTTFFIEFKQNNK